MKIKTIFIIGILIMSIFLLITPTITGNADDHDDDHDHHDITESQCDNSTEHRVIPSVHLTNGELSFGANELKVSKGACVMIHFVNPYDTLHDFVIDPVSNIDFDGIHLVLENSTAGLNGTNQHIVNIQMPDEDISIEYYCSVTGHKEAGMIGKLIVGNGSPETALPGFDLGIIFSLFFLFIAGFITDRFGNFRKK
ncbi:MAG: hypothetical protein HeimC3_33900 [Candidatus Heimdallarchaeota archaeon LC_3]|nr:MAG: hypothetical protein HeimC3_33900 [Candidatus Heimdallarchaeota archaeon LC_3]